MTHTPEPWKLSEDYTFDRFVVGKYGTRVVTGVGEQHEPNARRIVACVNACAGIPTGDLAVLVGCAINDIRKQNAALSEQVAWLVGAIDIWQENPTTGNGFALIDAAAIAKAGSHE